MRNLSLHPLWHSAMPAYEHTIGAGTMSLSALAFYLMITKTPLCARPFVKYLMLLQASITFVDLTCGLLFCPIALFPLPGGLCYGIICTWLGFNGNVGNSVLFLAISIVAVSVLYCFHYKFVSISVMVGMDSLESHRHAVFRVFLLILYTIPCIVQSEFSRNLEDGARLVKKEFPSLYYLFENEEYHAYAYDVSPFSENSFILNSYAICMLLFTILLFSYFLAGSFIRLSKHGLLSERTRRLQHKLIVMLVIQTIVPMTIQLTPIMVYVYSMITISLNPNVVNAVMCFQLTHAFIHTTILISSTPSYREALCL